MARCTDCDRFLTDLDRAAMRRVNGEASRYTNHVPYPLDDPDTVEDLHCEACIEHAAEQAQARRDEDYYGGSSPTLAETAAQAARFK